MKRSCSNIRIETASPGMTGALAALLPDARAKDPSKSAFPGRRSPLADLPGMVRDGLVTAAVHDGKPIGFTGILPERGRLLGPIVTPEYQRQGLGCRLLEAAERLAAAHQLFRLEQVVPERAAGFFSRCGYRRSEARARPADRRFDGDSFERTFPRRQTGYGREIARLGEELGIPGDYGRRHRLPLQPEATRLASAGDDLFGRPQRLTPAALSAWTRMRDAAAAEDIRLQIVSAFRSVAYQAELLRRKLEKGLAMGDILAVSAAPGFSEHHSGRALDLTTPGAPVLEEAFEATDAFRWLDDNAHRFGFNLSYPRNNRHGVMFEPWHWCHDPRRLR